MAEHELLPVLRTTADDSLIIADGFSCRTQIEQATGRHALHLAEVIELWLRLLVIVNGADGGNGGIGGRHGGTEERRERTEIGVDPLTWTSLNAECVEGVRDGRRKRPRYSPEFNAEALCLIAETDEPITYRA